MVLQPGRVKKAKTDIAKHSEKLKVYLTKKMDELPVDRYCTVFGCGRELTIREKLFGNKCINHSKNVDISTCELQNI